MNDRRSSADDEPPRPVPASALSARPPGGLFGVIDFETAPDPFVVALMRSKTGARINAAAHQIECASMLVARERPDGTWTDFRLETAHMPATDEIGILRAIDRFLLEIGQEGDTCVTFNGVHHDFGMIRRRAARFWLFECEGIEAIGQVRHVDLMRTITRGWRDEWPSLAAACAGLTDTIAVRVEGLYHDQDVAGRDAVHQRRWGVAPSLTIGLGTAIDLDALSADEIAERLSAQPEERAAFIRQAAEAGHAEAQAVLGQMLLDGSGVVRDAKAALHWFSRAAAQRHPMAMNMVGRCYDLGWGTRSDKERAAQCYLFAAMQGLDWAMYNYATLLALGEGVPLDRAEAYVWLEKAAAVGNSKAINFIGSFHEDGWVVAPDMDVAADCYRRAAEGGDFRGQFNHARMLAAKGAVAEALPWLSRAAENGNERFRAQAAAWLDGAADADLRVAASLFRTTA